MCPTLDLFECMHCCLSLNHPTPTPCAFYDPPMVFAPDRATAERDRIRQQVSLLPNDLPLRWSIFFAHGAVASCLLARGWFQPHKES